MTHLVMWRPSSIPSPSSLADFGHPLQTASSEKAKAKVKEVLDAPEAALQAASLGVEVSERNAGLPMAMRAEVEFTRLSQTELPARPVAVAGAWGDATADDVLNAGHAAPSGTFGVFSADAGKWLGLVCVPAVGCMMPRGGCRVCDIDVAYRVTSSLASRKYRV